MSLEELERFEDEEFENFEELSNYFDSSFIYKDIPKEDYMD